MEERKMELTKGELQSEEKENISQEVLGKRKEFFELVEWDGFNCQNPINDKEREIASKILNTLNSMLMIRAISLLKFCLKALEYSKVDFKSE